MSEPTDLVTVIRSGCDKLQADLVTAAVPDASAIMERLDTLLAYLIHYFDAPEASGMAGRLQAALRENRPLRDAMADSVTPRRLDTLARSEWMKQYNRCNLRKATAEEKRQVRLVSMRTADTAAKMGTAEELEQLSNGPLPKLTEPWV